MILDWMLPGLDGLEVLRQIRCQSPTPVMMLTACVEGIARVLGLEVGIVRVALTHEFNIE